MDRDPGISPTSAAQSEIGSRMHFDTIRYSIVWEDIGLLCKALDVQSDDDLLCITSAGDNVLGLLLEEPRSVTAIDLNPCQNHLLELKLAAVRSLDHADFLALIGIVPSSRRKEIYRACRSLLSDDARAWWDGQGALLEAGIVGSGRLEQYFRHWHETLLPEVVEPAAVAACLDLDDIPAQRAFFESHLAVGPFREQFEWYFGEEMMASRGRDQAQFAYAEKDAGSHFYDRFRYAFTELPLHDNFYLHWFLTGAFRSPNRMHPYLLERNFDRLRKLSDRVRIVTAPVEAMVDLGEEGSVSKAGFSNLFEYMSPASFEALMARIHSVFRPGARIAWWSLLAERKLAPSLRDRYQAHVDVAHQLWQQDRSWFYQRFHVAETI
jgi:S-adenosylmethionine-diacylglycerol 3-amino-3-carboxypropyl transferase